MKTEVLMYAVKIGAEDWEEQIITTLAADPSIRESAREWALSHGFDRVRFAEFNGEAPDFSQCVVRHR